MMFSRDQHPKDRAEAPISLLKILDYVGTAYRLGCERCRQRRQLMEMDDRQLKDIGNYSGTGQKRSAQADLAGLVVRRERILDFGFYCTKSVTGIAALRSKRAAGKVGTRCAAIYLG
jgi:uncharacterized protein YjiS (DUF1127 family)